MEEDREEDNTYVAQLREVFDSCDNGDSGYLNREELVILCNKLQLAERTNLFIQHLLGENCDSQVNFEEFKEGFVHLLTHSVEAEADNTDDVIERPLQQFSEQEVSPKFTFGKKKYGRRSRPTFAAGSEMPVTSSSSNAQCHTDSSGNSLLPGVSYVNQDMYDITSNKRRVSMETTQQPPHKSGRLSTSFVDESSGPQCFELASSKQNVPLELDSCVTFQDSNPEEYLQGIWKKLGVGDDGYLRLDELRYVCEHIGMEMSEEVITQLFEKLDCDQDGKVSFEEFLQGLFQHGGPNTSPDVSDSSSSVSPLHHKGIIYKDGSVEDHKLAAVSESGFFSCIDTDKTGYAESSTLVELWESLEVTEGMLLLKELGFNVDQKINLQDLTSVLEDELESSRSSPLHRCAFLSLQNDLRYLRLNYDQLLTERDKLKEGITEANTRAALLAQEVDEHHAKLESSLQNKLIATEKKFQEQLRSLQEELQRERENLGVQSLSLKQQFQKDVNTIREEETKLKNHMDVLKQENSRLEQELQDITERYLETARISEAQQKELSSASELKQKVAELESCRDQLQEQQHHALLLELENHQRMNKELQDRIDELVLELENIRHSTAAFNTSANKQHHRTGSWLSDYKKASGPGSLKRRGSGSSTEENSDDDSPAAGKIRRRLLPLKDGYDKKLTFGDEHLQDDQREELEKLRTKHEQAGTSLDINYQNKVAELETQLERNLFSQCDVNSYNSYKNQSQCEITQTLHHMQENLQLQVEVRNTLEKEVKELKEKIKQLTEENNHISNERDLLKFKISKNGNTLTCNNKDFLLEEQHLTISLRDECKKQFSTTISPLEMRSNTSLEHKNARLKEGSQINEGGEHTASNIANMFRQDLCQVLQSLAHVSMADVQKKLENLLLQALKTIETQLRTFHLEEQERLKNQWEEKLTKICQKRVMEQLEVEVHHKKEFQKFYDRSTSVVLELEQPNTSDILMKEMYLENARLVRKLQLAEKQQQMIEKNNVCLQYKCKILSKLLAEISRATVA